jgi:hypothetical protein
MHSGQGQNADLLVCRSNTLAQCANEDQAKVTLLKESRELRVSHSVDALSVKHSAGDP